MKKLNILLLWLLFCSCDEHFTEKELYGYYAPVGYKNNFDTIELKPKGVYYRKVYDKNNKLLLDTKGRWQFENNHSLKIDSFYLNLDNDLVRFPYLIKDIDMGITTYFDLKNGVIQFCVGYHQGENCYQKLK